jgi:hypothetical protein
VVVQDLPGGEWRRVQRASGYRYIMVNGVVTFVDGQSTQLAPGLLLRRGSSWNKPQMRRASEIFTLEFGERQKLSNGCGCREDSGTK